MTTKTIKIGIKQREVELHDVEQLDFDGYKNQIRTYNKTEKYIISVYFAYLPMQCFRTLIIPGPPSIPCIRDILWHTEHTEYTYHTTHTENAWHIEQTETRTEIVH